MKKPSHPSRSPITIPLSEHQQARFLAKAQEARAAVESIQRQLAAWQNEQVTTIIAATHDPASFVGWQIALNEDAIVCTPPAPEKVP